MENGSPAALGELPSTTGEDVVVRQTRDRDQAEDWALVLAAIGVRYRLQKRGEGELALLVSVEESPQAFRALGANDQEARAGAEVAPPAPTRGTGVLGVALGVLWAAFPFITGLWESHHASPWFVGGVADAERMRAGEWWRAVTAMTLHADVMHVLGNVAASLIFISAASRWLGAGVAAALILLAGTGANLLTALVEEKHHLSVGASTATFAALGLVVGLQVVRRWRGGGPVRRRAWVAAGAGLALLAMLGVSAKADVFAHAFGLGLGAGLGLVAGVLDRPRPASTSAAPRPWLAWMAQGSLALAALGAVVLAWARALGRL